MPAQLSPTVQALLQLFEGPLHDVRFPDADASTLGASIDELNRAQLDVQEAEAALATTREQLKAKESALLQVTQRALAYVRVYAQDKPELLEALPSPAKTKRAAPEAAAEKLPKEPGVRRGRPARTSVKNASAAE